LETIVINQYANDDIEMFYGDYRRRVELLSSVLSEIKSGAAVLDAGCAPGFTSLALKFLGYKVYSIDFDPDPYSAFLKTMGIDEVFKVDLERDKIPLEDESVDFAVFTEVLEHLHPFYLSWTLSEINRVLKKQGLLFLTTPNIVSIGKRTSCLLGRNPVWKMHVKEYTLKELKQLIAEHGYSLKKSRFSLAYNLTPHDANGKDYQYNLLKATYKHPTKDNIFHLLTVPAVFAVPTLRATISIIARKESSVKAQFVNRRF
jgi:SAM-dependent methyltransferase